MTPLFRPSVELKLESALTVFIRLVVGGAIMAFGAALAYLDAKASIGAKERLHAGHMSLCLGTVLFGAWVAIPRFVQPPIERMWVWIGQTSIPWVGGRRKDDPQPPKDAP